MLGHANLETTTIYVHVAKPDDSTSLPSPIDGIKNGISDSTIDPTSNKIVGGTVGRLKVHTRKHETEDATQVTIEIFAAGESSSRVFLTGILASEERSGFWTLRFPPLEHWQPILVRLPSAIRQRIGRVQFYERMRSAIVKAL